MKRLICLLCACLCGLHARAEFKADRLWVNAGFYSAHFDTDKGLRNANPGIGVEYRIDPLWSATAGRFRNSNNADSSYVVRISNPGPTRASSSVWWPGLSTVTPMPTTAAGFRR